MRTTHRVGMDMTPDTCAEFASKAFAILMASAFSLSSSRTKKDRHTARRLWRFHMSEPLPLWGSLGAVFPLD
jgi:hypothetical protein